jgi:UDP-glucose 4-epimerase
MIITGNKGMIGSRFEGDGIDLKDGLNLLSCDLPETDLIYHFASQISVESSWADPLHDLDNIRMMARLVKRYPKARIIYTSSAAALDVTSPYGFSKWAAGEYLKKFHSNYVICYLPNLFGGGSGVMEKFKGKKEVTVYGDGLQVRDFVHIDDIVKALHLAKDWPTGEYQLGSGKGTRIIDLTKGKTVTYAPPRKEIRESILRNDAPNWEPSINVLEYI